MLGTNGCLFVKKDLKYGQKHPYFEWSNFLMVWTRAIKLMWKPINGSYHLVDKKIFNFPRMKKRYGIYRYSYQQNDTQ